MAIIKYLKNHEVESKLYQLCYIFDKVVESSEEIELGVLEFAFPTHKTYSLSSRIELHK